MVRLDNGARNGQSHAHALGLAGEKRFEDFLQFVFGNARAAVRHDFDAANRAPGWSTWLTFAISPTSPTAEAKPTRHLFSK